MVNVQISTGRRFRLEPLQPCNRRLHKNLMSTKDDTPTAVDASAFAVPANANVCEDPNVVAASKFWKVACWSGYTANETLLNTK